MKGYELLKAISDGEIKDGTKIEIKGRFTGDLKGSYFIYNEGNFRFPIYEPNGIMYSNSLEIHDLINFDFEVIEENKEIEELEISEKDRNMHTDYINSIANKLNEVIDELNKEREEK